MTLVSPPDSRGRPTPVRVRRPSERHSVSRSATRALDVLEYFAQVRGPLRAVDIARRLVMRPSTTNQLLKTMVGSAHLTFDARTMTYLPSPRLVGFADWLGELYGREDWLRSLVADVAHRTGMIVTLSTDNDLFMQVMESGAPPGVEVERGLRISLFGSAVGSALLSELAENEVRRLADRARVPEAQMPALFDQLELIRRDGAAVGPTGAGIDGRSTWSIALPLRGGLSPIRLVLGLAGDAAKISAGQRDIQAVLTAAIERWRPEPIDRYYRA